MTDTTPNPAPDPTPLDEAAAAAAASPPTYSPPTTAPEAPPAPVPVPAPAAPQAPPVAAPAPVTGPSVVREGRSGGITGGVILIALGVIFLASEFVPGFDIGKLWPLILVAIGVGIILRRR